MRGKEEGRKGGEREGWLCVYLCVFSMAIRHMRVGSIRHSPVAVSRSVGTSNGMSRSSAIRGSCSLSATTTTATTTSSSLSSFSASSARAQRLCSISASYPSAASRSGVCLESDSRMLQGRSISGDRAERTVCNAKKGKYGESYAFQV